MVKGATSETLNIQSALQHFIRSNYFAGVRDQALGEDDSLVERGVIDSTGILELVGFVEEQFHIKVEDQELVPENFDTLRRLISYIGRKQAHAA